MPIGAAVWKWQRKRPARLVTATSGLAFLVGTVMAPSNWQRKHIVMRGTIMHGFVEGFMVARNMVDARVIACARRFL